MTDDPLSSGPLAIDAEHLSVLYRGQTALDDVSVAVPAGRYVGIVGPNGAGKTTLMRVLLGLQEPSAGSVRVFGMHPRAARRGGTMGYVPQRVAQGDIAFSVTVEEAVMTGRASKIGLGRFPGRGDREAVEHALTITDTSPFRRKLLHELSGGQRQRVFIARALAAEPKMLLLDEPTTGVDVSAKESFYALLRSLHKEKGLTILFVSHDVEVTAQEADFVLALNQKLICHCSSHDFLSEDVMTRLYGAHVEFSHPHAH
jgi:zinc transport system ATP-binding protein